MHPPLFSALQRRDITVAVDERGEEIFLETRFNQCSSERPFREVFFPQSSRDEYSIRQDQI